MIKKLKEAIKARKLRKQEKTELVAMIEDLDQKLKIQIDKAVIKIEELSQEKLYFLYVDTSHQELIQIKQNFNIIKKRMKWTAPNILILNKPLIELSKKQLKELEKVRQNLEKK